MESSSHASKQVNDLQQQLPGFCTNPACFGIEWHDWGCCCNYTRTSLLPATSSELSLSRSRATEDHTHSQETPLRMSVPESKRFALLKTEQQVKDARINALFPRRREMTLLIVCDYGQTGRRTGCKPLVPLFQHSQNWTTKDCNTG